MKNLTPLALFLCLLFLTACTTVGRQKQADIRDPSGESVIPAAGKATWREPAAGITFVWVSGGCFEMGQTDSERNDLLTDVREEKYLNRYGDEILLHGVCLDAFWMSATEVTVAQFRKFIAASGYETDAEKEGFSRTWNGEWETKQNYIWQNAASAGNPNHPVVNVSWQDAKAMASWLSRKNSRVFRLPSEAQWEFACRAGKKDVRFWGDSPQSACSYANIADQSARNKYKDIAIHDCNDGFIDASPTGSFQPNAFGFYDLLGNVWEWCEDWYGENYYQMSPLKNPQGPSSGNYRVMRGGFWLSGPNDVRCANRSREIPRGRADTYGFRLVMITE
jgi:sulfatase modifying factor 1